MIEVADVSKSFAGRQILKDISLTACPGEIYGLIGYNGVGKTTLMKIISGIYRPDKGRVSADGIPVYEHPEVKRDLFFMTEEPPFFSGSSMDLMSRFYKGYYPNWDDEIYSRLTDFFGLNEKMPVDRFSKGMQRQAGIVMAFASGTKMLLLDEAFDGLDEVMRKSLSDMIRYYTVQFQAVVIISSHNLRELEHLADRIGLLSDGELIYDDAVKEMKAHYQGCQFRLPEAALLPEVCKEGMMEQNGNVYRCVVKAKPGEVTSILKAAGAEEINEWQVHLEEFFRKDRVRKTVNWGDVFGK